MFKVINGLCFEVIMAAESRISPCAWTRPSLVRLLLGDCERLFDLDLGGATLRQFQHEEVTKCDVTIHTCNHYAQAVYNSY